MEKIGQLLKSRREELGYSIDAMSQKTRVPAPKLQAIEAGNLKYFEHDMSYVKFYLRYYCNALHLNYEDYKEEIENSLEDFSNTTRILKQVEVQESNARVFDRTHPQMKPKIKGKKKQISIDYSMLAIFGLSLLLIAVLSFVIIRYVMPNVLLNQTIEVDEELKEIPEVVTEEDQQDPQEEVIDKILNVVKKDTSSYEITGFNEGQEIVFQIQFKSNAYVSVSIDGVSSFNPASQLYKVGSVLDLKLNAKDTQVVEVYIGWMNGNLLSFNGELIELDPSISSKNGSVKFLFTFIGDKE